MATTPHSSWNLSNIRFESSLVRGFQSRNLPRTERHVPLPDLNPLFDCKSDDWSENFVLVCDRLNSLGLCSRYQNPRRRFVENQHFRSQVGLQIDLRTNFGGTKGALRERNTETAIAQIVRGFGQPFVDDPTHRIVHALLVFEIERGRQTPEFPHNFLGVLRAAELRIVARALSAKQHDRTPRMLERYPHRRRCRHESHNSDHGCRIDTFAERLVVQADVAARDRGIEESARLR